MTGLRLIDTSVWIRALGSSAVPAVRNLVASLVEKREAAVCAPVAFELLRGVPDKRQSDELLDYLSSLQSLPVDWVGAARWSSEPAVRRLKVKSMDLLIAHTALANSAVLLHADSDFDRLARATELKAENPLKPS